MASDGVSQGSALRGSKSGKWLLGLLSAGAIIGSCIISGFFLVNIAVSADRAVSQWQLLGLGSPVDQWPPAGTFIPADGGPALPGVAANSVSSILAINTLHGLITGELGSQVLSVTSTKELASAVAVHPGGLLKTNQSIRTAVLLSAGGVAVGGSDTRVDLWPNKEAVGRGGTAPRSLPTSGSVSTLAGLPNGGLAAASERGLQLWPTTADVAQGGPAPLLLRTSGVAIASAALPAGGLVLGTASGIDVWPRAVAVSANGTAAPITLMASGGVQALAALGSGLVAGTDQGSLEVWPNRSVMINGSRAPLRLQLDSGVQALAVLSGGEVAVSTSRGNILVWPSLASLENKSSSPILLYCSMAPALLPLASGGLAAGSAIGAIDLWPDSAAVHAGGSASTRLQAGGMVNTLVLLPGNGLAAGTSSTFHQGGAVALWPNVSLVQQGSKRAKLFASLKIQAIAPTAQGGLVAATTGRVLELWPDSTSLQEHQSAPVRLPLEAPAIGLAGLGNGGIVASAGLFPLSMEIWPNASAVNAGGAAPLSRPFSTPLLTLSSGGLAAAGDGRVALWPDPSSILDQPNGTFVLPVNGPVIDIVETSQGGLVVATLGAILVWPNSTAVQVGGPAPLSLPPPNNVELLCSLPDGGLVAYLVDWTVAVWPDWASVASSAPPLRSSLSPASLASPSRLAAGGIAAAINLFPTVERAAAVAVWPDVTAVLRGGAAPILLQLPNTVNGLCVLQGGGLAAAFGSIITLWSDLEEHTVGKAGISSVPSGSLAPSGMVVSASSLADGGLAIGTFRESMPAVDLWTSSAAWSSPEQTLLTSGLALAAAQFVGTFAVGTDAGTADFWSWPISSSSQRTTVSLGSACWVRSLALLSNGYFVAGCDMEVAGEVVLWTSLSAAVGGGKPTRRLNTTGPVWTLLAWPETGGLVAGLSTGRVEAWPDQASLDQGGPPPIELNASGSVTALEWLPGGGLAVATAAPRIDVWLSKDSLWSGGNGKADASLQTPATAASIAISPDGCMVAGGAIFTPLPCPAGDYSPGRRIGECSHCPQGWLSIPRAPDCRFAVELRQAISIGGLALFVLLAAVAAHLSQAFCKAPDPDLRGSWGNSSMRSSRSAGAQPGLSQQQVYTLHGAAFTLSLLGSLACGGSLVVATLHLQWGNWTVVPNLALGGTALLASVWCIFPGLGSARLLAEGMLLLAGLAALLLAGAPPDRPVLTPFGAVTPMADPSVHPLLALGLVLAGASCVLQRVLSVQTRPAKLPVPQDRPSAIWTAALLRRGTSSFRPSIEIEESHVDTWGRSDWTSGSRRLAAGVTAVGSSWVGQHSMTLVLGLFTSVQMGWQFFTTSSLDARAGLVLSTAMVAAIQVMISTTAIVSVFCTETVAMRSLLDRHLRLVVVLKHLALGGKFLVLNMPFSAVLDVYLWWQCKSPALCPVECTGKGGVCGTNTSFQCTCSSWSAAKVVTVLNCALTNFFGLLLTTMRVVRFWHPASSQSVQRPHSKLIAQIGVATVPNVVQIIYLILLSNADLDCMAMADVAVILYPSLLLALLANEAKRAVSSWRYETAADFCTLWSDNLLLALRPLAACASAMATALCAARGRACSPLSQHTGVDCGRFAGCWYACAVLYGLGTISCIALGPMVPHFPDGEALAQEQRRQRSLSENTAATTFLD